jgi:hypothetical protein
MPLIAFGWWQLAGDSSDAEPLSPAQAARRAQQIQAETNSRSQGDTDDDNLILPASGTDADGAVISSAAGQIIAPPDDSVESRLTGEWEDDYQGKRHLTVASDGTGTMVVDLDGIGKKLFAARMSFDMDWSVADGHVTMKTLGGEPKSKVQLVLKLYGNEARYKILELTPERMLLLDPDGKTKYDWRRPGASQPATEN